jgi:hypothetical protein
MLLGMQPRSTGCNKLQQNILNVFKLKQQRDELQEFGETGFKRWFESGTAHFDQSIH